MEQASKFLPILKEKKEDIFNFIGDGYFNHPNRVETVEITGLLDYTVDERLFTGAGTSADLYEFSLDVSDHPAWTRIFILETPFTGVVTFDNEGEFVFLHQPNKCWAVWDDRDPYTSSTKVGTCTRTPYTRTITDPGPPVVYSSWTAGTPVVTDIDLDFDFYVDVAGGDSTSGGKDDTTKTELDVSIVFSGTHSSLLPVFDTDNIERFPWTAVWADEDYSSVFTAHVAAGNTADGGGHSGTCTVKVEFTNQV